MTENERTSSTPILQDDVDGIRAHAARGKARDEEVPTEKPVAGQSPDQDGPDDVEGHVARPGR